MPSQPTNPAASPAMPSRTVRLPRRKRATVVGTGRGAGGAAATTRPVCSVAITRGPRASGRLASSGVSTMTTRGRGASSGASGFAGSLM
jgi:hypothetical protein